MKLDRRTALAAALLAAGALGAGYVGLRQPAAVPLLETQLGTAPQPVAITPLVAAPTATAPVALVKAQAPAAIARLLLGEDPRLASAACPLALDLAPQPYAMLGLTLLAPCRPDQRVVLRHGGLAITAQTSATGALFLTLPALEQAAVVAVRFGDGQSAKAQIEVPELAGLRRFGVQWLADDAFQVHAFEGEADYGATGDVRAANPQQPVAGKPATGGFLTILGDGRVDLPMQAEIYTYPADPAIAVRLVVEAAVSAQTCGRELLGEMLDSTGGGTTVTDLSLMMPECDAVGDILVLNNLAPDLKIAAR
ncbi:MAG: hypothetical protein GW902_05885 [Alphaproteobacteria bacterium]|nr:hypothetical protein [Alphaproteobacteria bacterium]